MQRSNQTKLYARLIVSKQKTTDLDEARQLARDAAKESGIAVTDKEVDAVAVLHAFESAVRKGDHAACDALARQAFELARDQTMHCVLQRDWVHQLINLGQTAKADAITRSYLEYLRTCDVSTLFTQNRILFWGTVLQAHRSDLPESVRLFISAFPFEDLNEPLPRQRFEPKEIPR